MSELFLKNTLNNIFGEVTETEVIEYVNIIDKVDIQQKGGVDNLFIRNNEKIDDSPTSSVFMKQLTKDVDSELLNKIVNQQKGGDSVTSSAYMGQMGGNKSKLAQTQMGGNSNQDINKLISMLTSESSNGSQTNTETLENQLRDIIGDKHNVSGNAIQQNAGSSMKITDIKDFFIQLKSQGVDVNVKLDNKSLSEFFGLAQNTSTEINQTNVISGGGGGGGKAKKSSRKGGKGGKGEKGEKGEKKISSCSVKKSTIVIKNSSSGNAKKSSGDPNTPSKPINVGFQAYLSFKKQVAETFNISNGPLANSIASFINTKMKEEYPDLRAVEIAVKNKEFMLANIKLIKDKFKDKLNNN